MKKWQLYNTQTKLIEGRLYDTYKKANNRAEKLNMEYGSTKWAVILVDGRENKAGQRI